MIIRRYKVCWPGGCTEAVFANYNDAWEAAKEMLRSGKVLRVWVDQEFVDVEPDKVSRYQVCWRRKDGRTGGCIAIIFNSYDKAAEAKRDLARAIADCEFWIEEVNNGDHK